MIRTIRAVVTAGGTADPVDDVRVITNRSSGLLGWELSLALAESGAEVRLLAGPALRARGLLPHPRVELVPFESFADLRGRLEEATAQAPDLVVMAAAVADYSPVGATGKLSSDQDELHLVLKRNPKLLSLLRERCGSRTVLCGFKLLAGAPPAELIAVAQRQLQAAQLDFSVANDAAVLGAAHHEAWLIGPAGLLAQLHGTKSAVARQLVTHWLSEVQNRG